MLIFDIETNGLLDTVNKAHCIAIYDTEKESLNSYSKETLPKAVQMLEEADTLIGHNIVKYDLPALQKLYPTFNPKVKSLIPY